MRYRIVTSHSEYDLNNSVNDLIKRGWKTQGGVSFQIYGDFREKWAQAMIKITKQ